MVGAEETRKSRAAPQTYGFAAMQLNTATTFQFWFGHPGPPDAPLQVARPLAAAKAMWPRGAPEKPTCKRRPSATVTSAAPRSDMLACQGLTESRSRPRSSALELGNCVTGGGCMHVQTRWGGRE